MRILRPMFMVLALCAPAIAQSSTKTTELKLVTWNIANLHHENDIPLRDRSEQRDQEDYDRLAGIAKNLGGHIFALQEVGSPAAIARVFPANDYHTFISERYKTGDENKPPEQRDIYTGFAISKNAFSNAPMVETISGLSITNYDTYKGAVSNSQTRAGIALSVQIGNRTIKILNVHMKSSCHGNSLSPIIDKRNDGSLDWSRYDCRTHLAMALILENWIEQQHEMGNGVVVLGDFNRRLNMFEGVEGKTEHWSEIINDGEPNLTLEFGPKGKNDNCWIGHDKSFYKEHIDFIMHDSATKVTDIQKVGMPFATDEKYKGNASQKLSDHCPVVGTLQ